jgi:multisubunit Na+/H+ antiporter MnhG subunit
MKINKTVLEHYLVALLVAGVAIYQTGNHHLKSILAGALIAVLGPVAHAAYARGGFFVVLI